MSNHLSSTDFSLVNLKAKGLALYRTTDASMNVMTFTLTNNSGAALQLTGGTPVDGHGGASSFVIDFSNILTEAQAADVLIKEASGAWGVKFFPAGSGLPPGWALAPVSDLTWAAGEAVVFNLTAVQCNSSQASGIFEVGYYNIPGMPDKTLPFTYNVPILAIPSGKAAPLDCGWLDASHFINPPFNPNPVSGQGVIPVAISYNNQFPVKNQFTLFLKNTSNNNLEKKDTPIGNALVLISFVFSDDKNNDNAITNFNNGKSVNIGVAAESSKWGTNPLSQDGRTWSFSPQSNQILFANETVQFSITNLITLINVDPSTISTITVQYSNFSGYDDGFFSIEAEKMIAKQSANFPFTVKPSTIMFGDTVQLSWQTDSADRVTLEYQDRDGGMHNFDSNSTDPATQIRLVEPGFSPVPNPSKPITIFTLTAYDATSNSVPVQQQLTVNQPKPVIVSFTATSYLVDIKASNTITLNWVVTGQKTVTLNGAVQTGNSAPVTINQTVTLTLVVTNYVGDTVQQSITIYAYKSYADIQVGPMGNGTTYQSWPLSFVNQSKGIIYVANAGSASAIQINKTQKVVTGSPLAGNVMVLSNDDAKLFLVQNQPAGSYKLSMYDVQNTPTASTINPNVPPPVCMIVSADHTRLYMGQQNGLSAISVFNLNFAQNTVTYLQDVTVGKSPSALAFDSTQAFLFVANYNSSNVSVVNVSTLAVVGTIPLGTSEAEAFALVGNKLFVACGGDNYVMVIDTTNITAAPVQIAVGGRPFSMALNQNNTLLFVCNFGQNTVSVINTSNNQVINTITVGNGPSDIKINDNGTLMFVSNYCDKSLSVIDLTNNQYKVIGAISLSPTNGNPVTVTISPSIDPNYTDVFIAREYFIQRSDNANCNKTATDAQLTMSIFSIEANSNSPLASDADIDEPSGQAPTAPIRPGLLARFWAWIRQLFGI